MSAIKGKNTKPEMAVRRALHAAGFRFRLHRKELPGSPDLVFRKYRAVLFVHGCFWHQHDCLMFKMPTEGRERWQSKLAANVQRDEAAAAKLAQVGWRVGIVWECALRGNGRLADGELVGALSGWLKGDSSALELQGSR